MAEWRGHKAFPYQRRLPHREQHTLTCGAATARDGRRPLSSARPSQWDAERDRPCLAEWVSGTVRLHNRQDGAALEWKQRVATPLWQPRSARPVLHTPGYVVRSDTTAPDLGPWMASCNTPLRQSRAAVKAQQRRAAEERDEPHDPATIDSAPNSSLKTAPYGVMYMQLMLHRPSAQRAYLNNALPILMRTVEEARREEAEALRMREAAFINQELHGLQSMGFSTPRPRKHATTPAPAEPVPAFNLREAMNAMMLD